MASGEIINIDKIVGGSSAFTADTTKITVNVCEIFRRGYVCTFYLSPRYVSVSTGGWVKIGTLNNGYRPNQDVSFRIPLATGAAGNTLVKIGKYGDVSVMPSASVDGWTDYFTLTYVI